MRTKLNPRDLFKGRLVQIKGEERTMYIVHAKYGDMVELKNTATNRICVVMTDAVTLPAKTVIHNYLTRAGVL